MKILPRLLTTILTSFLVSGALAETDIRVDATDPKPAELQRALKAKPLDETAAKKTEQARQIIIVHDLGKIIELDLSADMTVEEMQALSELGQKSLGLRNLIQYQRAINKRLVEIDDRISSRVVRATLRAEKAELEGKYSTAGDLAQMMALELQEAMQAQSQQFTLMSNLMKSQHETLKAIIQNMKA